MFTIRSAQWPHDIALLAQLETSFTTERIYRPVQEGLAFRLMEEAIQPPLRKQYAFDPSDPEERRNWQYTALAEANGDLAGFAAAQYVTWNRRVVLWHLYVTPRYRHCGVGTRLLEAIDIFASSVQARCVWLETQNVNYPAIQFYQKVGFEFCGFDTSLYDPHSLEQTETALFFARPVSDKYSANNTDLKL